MNVNQETIIERIRSVGNLLANSEQSELYCSYLTAVCDEDAMEGSLFSDNFMAAKMLRDKAKEIGDKVLSEQKLATIIEALSVIMLPYRQVPVDEEEEKEKTEEAKLKAALGTLPKAPPLPTTVAGWIARKNRDNQ